MLVTLRFKLCYLSVARTHGALYMYFLVCVRPPLMFVNVKDPGKLVDIKIMFGVICACLLIE